MSSKHKAKAKKKNAVDVTPLDDAQLQILRHALATEVQRGAIRDLGGGIYGSPFPEDDCPICIALRELQRENLN